MGYIDAFVCADDEHIYAAKVDPAPAARWNGWVSPGFRIDVVRQLAARTAQAAARYGHDAVDEIRVIDSGPEPVVLHIRWMYLRNEPATAANVVKPDADGLYWIGGWERTWRIVEDAPLFYPRRAAFEAWKQVLTQSAHRIGEILREQLPIAASALLDLSTRPGEPPHLHSIETQGGHLCPVGGDTSPFDVETIGEVDEILRQAAGGGCDPLSLELGGWRRARDIGEPELHRIRFAPPADTPYDDRLLEDAHAKATTARRKLLTATVPFVAADARAVCPDSVGIVINPLAGQPFVAFLVEDAAPGVPVPDAAYRMHDRLAGLLAFSPTGDDLTACGWTACPKPSTAGGYALIFPVA